MYQPMFAAYITAGTRIKLLDALWKHRDEVLTVNTDGAFLKRKINIRTGTKLGDWSVTEYDTLRIMGNGRYFIFGEDGELNLQKSAFRGLRSAKKNMCVVDGQMNDPNRLGVNIEYQRPLKLKECVRARNFEGINNFVDKQTNISFILDRRVWDHEITNNNQLLEEQIDSRPFHVDEIVKNAPDMHQIA